MTSAAKTIYLLVSKEEDIGVRENPGKSDALIAACLEANYGLSVDSTCGHPFDVSHSKEVGV